MIRKRVCFWERIARELGYKILTCGIGWMHCEVKNNVSVLLEYQHDLDLFVVHVKIMNGEDFERYYYGPHRRENLKENLEEFIKRREEDVKLRKTTK